MLPETPKPIESAARQPTVLPTWLVLALGAFTLVGLYLTSRHDYLVFHGLVEILSVVIAWGIFMLAWNSRHLMENNYLLFLGIAYLFIGGINLLHTLAYRGMGMFAGDSADLPTQLWIGLRYIESLSMLVAPLFLTRRMRLGWVYGGYIALVGLLLGSIFYWKNFPVCYAEGVGLTPFKKISEYVTAGIFLGAIGTLMRRRREFDPQVFRFLVMAIGVTIASGLVFSLYVSVYGLTNMVGHLLRLLSSYLIYRAIIQTGIIRPFDLLFRNLTRSEKKLFSLLEEMPAFVYLQATDYTIRFANRAFRRYFGDPAGRTCHELLQHLPEPCEGCSVMEVLETGTPREQEWSLLDGRTYQIFEYPFSDIDESPQVLKLGIDITDRKRAEEGLREARDALEERVRERTAELMEANAALQKEIQERKRVEAALLVSEEELRMLSSRLLTAQEEERKRIAMELHDSIGASLSAIKFAVEHSLSQLRSAGDPAVRTLQPIIPMVQNTVDEVRRMHTGIWPSILDDLGIVMAIQWFCRQFSAAHPDIAVETELGVAEEEVPDALKIVVYRIMQEALNNAAKHSRAAGVRVVFGTDGADIELRIEDNGVGIPAELLRRGLGLTSMRERAAHSGGLFEMRSGQGTTVRIVWPNAVHGEPAGSTKR